MDRIVNSNNKRAHALSDLDPHPLIKKRMSIADVRLSHGEPHPFWHPSPVPVDFQYTHTVIDRHVGEVGCEDRDIGSTRTFYEDHYENYQGVRTWIRCSCDSDKLGDVLSASHVVYRES